MSTSTMMKRLAAVNTLPPGVDGMGYETDHIEGGAGFSYTRYASKQMVNGVWVNLTEHLPSPLDAKATGITSHYCVCVGVTDTGEDLPCPFFVPGRSTSFAPDAEVNWYAEFGDDGESAEAFALSMGPDASKLEPRWVVDKGARDLYMNHQAQSLRPKFY